MTAPAPPVRTDFWEPARGDQPIKSAVPDIAWVDADRAAKAGVDGLASGSRVVVPGFPVRPGSPRSLGPHTLNANRRADDPAAQAQLIPAGTALALDLSQVLTVRRVLVSPPS